MVSEPPYYEEPGCKETPLSTDPAGCDRSIGTRGWPTCGGGFGRSHLTLLQTKSPWLRILAGGHREALGLTRKSKPKGPGATLGIMSREVQYVATQTYRPKRPGSVPTRLKVTTQEGHSQ